MTSDSPKPPRSHSRPARQGAYRDKKEGGPPGRKPYGGRSESGSGFSRDKTDRKWNKPRTPGGGGDWKKSRPGPGGYSARPQVGPRPSTPPREPEPEISPFIRKLARLKSEKNRLEFSQFLLEGKKLIRDVIGVSPDIIMDIYLTENFADAEFITYVKEHRVRIKKVSEAEIRHLSEVETPQGIVATARFSTLKVEWAKCRYVTLLDSIQDPGNLGSIFRTSLALGGGALILGKGTCDPYNSKVVRSSAHAFLQLPFEAGVDLAGKIKFLRKEGFTILAATPHASTPITHAKMRKKVALLIGNEGAGVDPRLLSMADAQVSIPHLPKVESLNAAVAHGILMYELITGRD